MMPNKTRSLYDLLWLITAEILIQGLLALDIKKCITVMKHKWLQDNESSEVDKRRSKKKITALHAITNFTSSYLKEIHLVAASYSKQPC